MNLSSWCLIWLSGYDVAGQEELEPTKRPGKELHWRVKLDDIEDSQPAQQQVQKPSGSSKTPCSRLQIKARQEALFTDSDFRLWEKAQHLSV